jgi:diguanylate cyclase (GGDEF)-like protein
VIFLLEAVFVLRAAPQVTSVVGILLVFANLAGWQVATQLNRIQRMNWMDRNRLRREVAERIAAEQRALAGEDNLRRLFDTTPVPMVLSQQPGGKVLRYNQAAENLLDPAGKVRAGEILYSADFFVDPAEFAQQREQLMRDGRVGPVDVHLRTTDGRVVDVMLSSAVMQFHGEPATIASLVEITARKRYEHELRRLAQTDPLTGLLNRRGFFAQAGKLIEELQTSGAPIAVLLMDADHFKRVNDAHGHAVGDEALRQIGAVIQTQLRDADALARVGGEEFACLLPGTSQQQAMDVAERIRTVVAMQSMHCAEVRVEVSLSIGVSVVADHEQRIDEALNRADRAMYVAKRAGRNRVDIMV